MAEYAIVDAKGRLVVSADGAVALGGDMPDLGKAILFFAAFCAVMGWAAIELVIWPFTGIGFVWLG